MYPQAKARETNANANVQFHDVRTISMCKSYNCGSDSHFERRVEKMESKYFCL